MKLDQITSTPELFAESEAAKMLALPGRFRTRSIRTNKGGGVLLDLVLVVGLILLGTFVLAMFGVTFAEVLQGAKQFFGV
ncbi:MAG: hypothetical protein WB778_10015 [Thermoplasmata archaeon]